MARNDQEKGFTLIELLVVITVIGVLVGIVFRELTIYQARAFDARAEHDLRVAVAAEEAFFSENEEYIECADTTCEELLGNLELSDGIRLTMTPTEEGDGFEGVAYHPKGEKRYRFTTESGVLRAL